jgi:DNA invertase Pin-like site-specific DNA recombinase
VKTGRPPKISREQYVLLRIRAASGVRHRKLAYEYGITRQSVTRIAAEGLKCYERQP